MKRFSLYILVLLCTFQVCLAQTKIQGRIISAADQSPLPGAIIMEKNSDRGTSADSSGRFSIEMKTPGVLVISFLGYKAREFVVSHGSRSELVIAIEPAAKALSEVVVSTGYQELPQERSPGSFTYVSNELLNRSTSSDILSRLETVTSGLEFNRKTLTAPDGEPVLRVRGVASMYGEMAPLIVVDNFPYEGKIEHINPNDVEDITILKDAAAASIWGARAGNGVIVIKTKKGRFNQKPKLSFNSFVSVSATPDLYYNPNFLESSEFIELEKTLFARNFYTGDEHNVNRPPLSPVVELLIAGRDGLLPSEEVNLRIESFKNQDIRRDYERYFYRPELNRQASVNLSGGADFLKYYLSAGVDKNASYQVGNSFERLNLSSQNTIKPLKKLEITLGLNYDRSLTSMNGIGMADVRSAYGKMVSPYVRLADENGIPLAVTKDYRESYVSDAEGQGLLDWQYRPLEELSLNDNSREGSEFRISTGIRYQVLKDLNVDFKYQYHQTGDRTWYHLNALSYSTRDLLNRYTQPDGSNPIPYGGYVNSAHADGDYHSGRGQVNFNRTWGDHTISFLTGMEIRDVASSKESTRMYGYHEEISSTQLAIDYAMTFPTRPFGSRKIPTASLPLASHVDRFISYYGNGSYEFRQKYTVTGSIRKDASNLFGVTANQKWVPLWSAGFGWDISREKFYRADWLPFLKLRASYGFTGNIDKSQSAFTVVKFSNDALTGLPNGIIDKPGNPDLRWERVGIGNLGLDFRSKNGRVSGMFEVFRKKGTDLVGNLPLDPTTGYLKQNKVNYADMVSRGMDVQLNTININKGFKWESSILFNHVSDVVTKVDDPSGATTSFFSIFSSPTVGKSLYRIYSYPDPVLDPATGDPLVMYNGELSRDYSNYYRNVPYSSLIDHGPQFPTFSGAFRNNVSWKGLTLSANISWKAGYVFRRSSILYDELFKDGQGHRDFAIRWQKPGDELITSVPSMPSASISGRDLVYQNSASLVEKGDHVRLQDLQMSYSPQFAIGRLPAGRIKFNIYANNLGLIWRANKHGIDPDYPAALYLSPRTISFGINVNL